MASKGITIELHEILADYISSVDADVQDTLQDVAKEAATKLRQVSAEKFKQGKYSKGWTTKLSKKDREATVYNKTQPGLTHLLENGHAKANQYGEYSPRVAGVPHIKPVEEWASAEFIRRVEEVLKNEH